MSNYKKENPPKPWERLPKETIHSYHAFCRYRDMGRDRSAPKVALELNRSASAMIQVCHKNRWVERTKAWIDELDRQSRETVIKEVKEMATRHAKQAMIHQKITMIPAEAIIKKLQVISENEKFKNLPIEKLLTMALDAANAFTKVVDVERKSRGEATEISKQDLTSAGETIKVILPPPIIKPEIENDI